MSRKWFVLLAALWLHSDLQAQTTRGTILGTITDQSGAPMAGVKVTLHQTATGLTRTEQTNDSGEYLVPELPLGPYTVAAEKPGFQTSERSGLTLQVDQRLRADIAMQVGQVSEKVVVESSAPVVSTDSATVGNVIDHKNVTELPLNGRNFLQLNLLVPGANQGVKGSQNQGQGGSITVNGAREAANDFLLDGVDNNDLAINQYTVAISPEAIQEFKVQASTYSAEFGRSGGAQINVATRAGTNEFHGVAYEFLRNAKLDAKNFFDVATAPIPPYKRNQFGGSFGGPIKRNKTFFFANYEGTRIRQSITKVSTVPTVAMKEGNFSALLGPQIGSDALGRPVYTGEIFDPTTLRYVNGQAVRDPFPNNTIPANRLNAVGVNVANAFPSPNTLLGSSFGQYTGSPGASDDSDQFTTRVDHSFSSNDNIFGRVTYSNETRFNTFDAFCATTNIPGYGCRTTNGGLNVVVDYTHIFSPNKINELKLGFNRMLNTIFQQDQGNDLTTQLGIIGTSRSPIDYGFPSVSVTGFDGIGDAGNLPQRRHDNTFDYADSFSWVLGNHSLKMGGEFRDFQLNLLFDYNSRGSLTFNPFYTAQATSTSGNIGALANTGNALADLLLGAPYTSSLGVSFGGITANTVTAFRTYSIDPYFQDDWHVSPKLTLNLGLRWEYNSPTIDKYNHLSTYDPSAPNEIRVATPNHQNLYDTSKKEFAPRVGLAWTPFSSKVVFRAGYGIFWDEKLLNVLLIPALSPPFLVSQTYNASTNGFPNISLAAPFSGAGSSGGFPSATWLESPFKDGYVQQWNVNVQDQITQSIGVTVGYVGSKGTHLDREYDANQPLPSPTFQQANRPNPAFSNITVDSASASSIYHALQISAEKRFTHGLSFLAAYTFSKSIDDGSAWNATVLNSYDFRAERGLSTFDARNRLSFSYTYAIPYGHGQSFGSASPAWMNLILGNWQTNGILTLQSGNPVDVTVGLYSLTGTQSDTRPDLISSPNTGPHNPSQWFNTAAFSDNFSGRFGNAGRDVVIGPGTQDFDFALLKVFPLRSESRYVQFRSEFFNIFNHPNFDNPVTTEASSAFGKILSAGGQDGRLTSRQIQFALRLVF